jgi:acyl-[acyl-carrier-protein]-phospholipid O-acyltransferase/long-chain-fatty-acid--[acyl-carrier-protein] ligase
MQFQPSETLKSRSYLSLILAQFLAAFNDQAIHIVAIFYAGDMLARYVGLHIGHWYVDDKAVISVVTACFISPFFFFSPLAGILADKYSKRTIVVFWKAAEVAMMGLAFIAFLLPHMAAAQGPSSETISVVSAILVISVVFMMGTHSAFFVPAKYGVMPEILQPVILSRGNGFLEGTSFVAQILGTTVGGILYSNLKSTITPQAGGSILEPGSEWLIGLLLLILAVIGALASLLMARVPPAAPERAVTWKLWQPLRANIRVMLRSKPLALAVLGIAFFTFMVLFARQTLLYSGETEKELQAALHMRQGVHPHEHAATGAAGLEEDPLTDPTASSAQNSESRVAFLIALISLGIGVGAPLAGGLSGNKVELGLVPLGAVFLILFTGLMALTLQSPWPMRLCLVFAGAAASFYIVPLYTLLQHRAPKDSKGSLVATSNFINVAGGLIAVGVFWVVTWSLEQMLGLNLEQSDVLQDPSKLPEYIRELERQMDVPRMLFIVASLMTAGILYLLCRQLPDFFVRSLLWMRSHGRYRLKIIGLKNLPSEGPVILATNCDNFESCMQVVTATDRFTRFILLESDPDERPPWLLRYLARRTGLVALRPTGETSEAWTKALGKAKKALEQGNLVGLTADGRSPNMDMVNLLEDLRRSVPAPILPVYCGNLDPEPGHQHRHSVIHRAQVVIGQPLRHDAAPEEIRRRIDLLGEWMRQTDRQGAPALTSMIPEAAATLPTMPATARPERPYRV